jgi:transposase
MDSHTHNVQVGKLEVVDTGRRRRWSEDEKLRIVAESLSGPRLASSTARRHGISTSLLFSWRRAYRSETLTGTGGDPGFVPAVVVPEVRPTLQSESAGRMEIVLANGRRIIVDAGVDIATLARLLAVLERR